MVQEISQGVLLTIHVQPKAARTEYVGIHGNALKFRVMAPPVEGAANQALCRFLAKVFGVPGSDVLIHSGHQGKRKRILVKHLKGQKAWKVLESLSMRSQKKS